MIPNFNNNEDLMLPSVQMKSYSGAMQCKANSVKMILETCFKTALTWTLECSPQPGAPAST